MDQALKIRSDRNLPALLASIALHAAVLVSLTLGAGKARPAFERPPDSIAMPGNAIEVEAPTPELAAPPPSPAAEPIQSPAPAAPPAAAAETITSPEPELAAEPSRPRPRPSITARASAARPARSAASAPKPLAPDPLPAMAGSDARPSSVPAGGTFGQEGLAPGVRRLGYAFTRAIPAATPGDAAWRELPSGHVGTVRIELEVDDNNRLGAAKRWQSRPGEPVPPAVLERLVERTLILLRAGQFALSGSNQAGTERLVIDVYLRDEASEGEAPDVVVQKKFDGASPGRPGKAYFRYGSGRAFEAKVTIVSSGK